jgi:hypothetical protein
VVAFRIDPANFLTRTIGPPDFARRTQSILEIMAKFSLNGSEELLLELSHPHCNERSVGFGRFRIEMHTDHNCRFIIGRDPAQNLELNSQSLTLIVWPIEPLGWVLRYEISLI